MTTAMVVRRAEERGRSDLGWLDSRHTFSFGRFQDPRWMGFGALRVLNDDRVKAGGGFDTHPHRDMEIVSLVLDGVLAHKDSLGEGGEIRFGDAQVMSAGTGIRHSEFNGSKREPVRFIQIWIEPREAGLKPRYGQKSFAFKAGELVAIASGLDDDGALPIYQDASVSVGIVREGQGIQKVVGADRHVWVQVATGDARVNGESLAEGDGVGLRGAGELEIEGDGMVLVFDLA